MNKDSNTINLKCIIKTEPSMIQRYEKTSSNNCSKYHLFFKNNNYLLKKKDIFKSEKIKEKENIFKLFKEIPKKQIKKGKSSLKKNHKQLLKSFATLNNANIDEGIVLNKYFLYLKNSNIEYRELMELKLKNMLNPIKEKEKEIQNIKKRIKFYKSISNQMLMKYMLDNKDQLYEYISSNKNKNTKNNYNDKTNSKTLCNSKNNFLSNSKNQNQNQNNTIIRRKLLENKRNKIIPQLKLKDDTNNFFITGFSRNNNKYSYKNKALTSPKNSVAINKKYYTPQTSKRKNKDYNLTTENCLSKINDSRRKTFKIKECKINNIFDKLILKD